MSKSVKESRREALIDVIQAQRIYTQSELVEKVASRGFDVTQTTISRDIENLQIVKGPKGYELPASLSDVPKWVQTVKEYGISVNCVGEYLLVLHTQSSTAQMIANEIDIERLAGVAGTIAGDDTIFIAVQDQGVQVQLAQVIKNLF